MIWCGYLGLCGPSGGKRNRRIHNEMARDPKVIYDWIEAYLLRNSSGEVMAALAKQIDGCFSSKLLKLKLLV
ncbi:hypothetical protein TorRG33x02_334080 [Trema orientale]|uniref:Uncharacterized protein n=1 Tax=Trema orientale TaxID=63057 RepID=A0A2P5B320_TREOI|nr:hypothetical protein TorRG33x02_334080 [Trema orientale]